MRHLLLLGHLPISDHREIHIEEIRRSSTLRPRQILQLHAHNRRALAQRRTKQWP